MKTRITVTRNKWFPKNKGNLFNHWFMSKFGNTQYKYNEKDAIQRLAAIKGLSPLGAEVLIRINDANCEEHLKESWTKAAFKYFLDIDIKYID